MRRLWIVVFILVLIVIFLPGLSKFLKLKSRDAELQKEVTFLKTEIERIEKEEYLLKTDVTRLEQVIREELGLVKPGEIVYKVVEEKVPAATKEEETSPKEQTTSPKA